MAKSKSKNYRLFKKYIDCQKAVTKIQNQIEDISDRLNKATIGTTKYTKIESIRNKKVQVLNSRIHKLQDASEKLVKLKFILVADEKELNFLQIFMESNPGWNGKIYPDVSSLNQLQRDALVVAAPAFHNIHMVDSVNYEDIDDDQDENEGDEGGGDDDENEDEDEDDDDEDENEDEGDDGD